MAAADEIYAAGFVAHWTGRPDTHGLDEFKAFVAEGRRRFPDWNETVEQIVAEGDLVVTRFTSRGTFHGEPSDPSHRRGIAMQEIAIHRIVDGKIVEQWTVADILGMRQQLGTLATPTEESPGFDFGVMDGLHEKGLILDPRGKSKSEP
jgi:predicted ester cyclase